MKTKAVIGEVRLKRFCIRSVIGQFPHGMKQLKKDITNVVFLYAFLYQFYVIKSNHFLLCYVAHDFIVLFDYTTTLV